MRPQKIMKPSYKHDCTECKFVGKIFRALDLDATKKAVMDVYQSCQPYGYPYLLRCSSEGSDYITTKTLEEYMA